MAPRSHRKILRAMIAAMTLGTGGWFSAEGSERAQLKAQESMKQGEAYFCQGHFSEAIETWQAAERIFAGSKDADGQVSALLREAAANEARGQIQLAIRALDSAEELVGRYRNRLSLAQIKATRGAISIFTRSADDAEPLLRESLKLARAEKASSLVANVLNDLGVVLIARDQAADADAVLEEAISLAQKEGSPVLAIKARKNLADLALRTKDFAAAERWVDQASALANALPDGHEKASLLMGAGKQLERIFFEAPEHRNELRRRAFELDEQAAKIAERIKDDGALSYARGAQGALYEFEKRYPEALALTRHAIGLAQREQSRDALYRWQWQSGRILALQGDRPAAIAAYRRAVGTLQSIRNDVSSRQGNRNARLSFREAVGALYFELADLLLQSADTLTEPSELQSLLREARDTAEMLKSAELEDYFQDDCVNLLKSKTKKVESISKSAAIVYIVPLADRTEVLISLPSGELKRIRSAIGSAALVELCRSLRLGLEDRTTQEYLAPAQELYTWLIKPLEPLMSANQLHTMVFVPDGALRTIPMAALHDGEHFLIEKYAVAVSPGLELMEAKPVSSGPARILISALSDGVQGFPPLEHVPQEIENIEKLYGQHGAMLNKDFLRERVAKRFSAEPFTIVHLASHGHFESDVKKSFVLTYDQHLSLDDLERIIRPAQLRDNGLELLTLSACQTAAGDDRAALGLAGVAVKAGARSAFATLWFVNDQASTEVVSNFYRELVTHPERSKAQALQSAQKELLRQERYQHPCYWAPYLIIGNWL